MGMHAYVVGSIILGCSAHLTNPFSLICAGLYNEVGVKFQAENYESSFSSVLGHHFFSYRNLVLGPISIPYIVPFCWPFTSGCCGSGASKQQQDATSAAAGSAGSSSGGSSSGSSMVYLRILKDLLYFLYATPRHLRSGALKPIHVDNSIRLSSSSSSSSPSASASFASSSARSGGAGSTTCSSSSGGAKITEEELTFLDYLKRERYSDDFIYRFALPMVAGICTCTQESAGKYPAYIVVHYLVRAYMRTEATSVCIVLFCVLPASPGLTRSPFLLAAAPP